MQEEYAEVPQSTAEVEAEASAIANMEPLEQIRYAAKKFGSDIKDPDKNCNYCYGRGYTGKRKSGEPIACKCIYPEMNEATKFAYDQRQQVPRNRRERRYMLKNVSKMINK